MPNLISIVIAFSIFACFIAVCIVNRNIRIEVSRRQARNLIMANDSPSDSSNAIAAWIRLHIEALLAGTGINLTASEFMIIIFASVVIPPFMLIMIGADITLALAAVLPGFILPILIVRSKRSALHKKFNAQLGNAMSLIAASVRGGSTILASITSAAESSPEPLKTELRYLITQINMGNQLDEALHALAVRNKSHDLEIFSVAISVQQEKGGEIANVIAQVGDTIRNRAKLKSFIESRTAAAKMQCKVLIAMPIIEVVLGSIVYHEIFKFYTSLAGLIVLCVCAVMTFLAAFIVYKWSEIDKSN